MKSPLAGSRILVTGHTGFKGSWLARYLRRFDVEIFGLSLEAHPDSLHTKLDSKLYSREFIQDIRNRDHLKRSLNEIKPKYIFHLAAQSLVLESYRHPIDTFEINVLGTANLLEVAQSVGSVERIVVTTTDKVYKNFENGRKYKESDPLEGNDPYSSSKVGAEAAIRAWQNIAAIDARMSIVSARAGNVIGGGDFSQHRLLPDIVRSHLSGIPMEIRNPLSTRPWQHVLDPIAGYVAAAEKDKTEEMMSINFGPSSSSLSVSTVIDIAKKSLKFETKSSDSGSAVFHEANFLDLDSTLAKDVLGWSNCWTQEEAVRSTVEWWKSVISGDLTANEAIEKEIDYRCDSLGPR